jgi:hypothetical protein
MWCGVTRGECDFPRSVGGWDVTLQEVVRMAEADTMVRSSKLVNVQQGPK